jgi:two-component system, cell cycle response regulator
MALTAMKPSRILVIDDSLTVRELIADYLKDSGYILETAASAEEGWERMNTLSPDLVICDWSMPGLSGIELCQRVREESSLSNIYFLLLTARDDHDDLVAGLNAGADEFLSKPIRSEELKARVRAGLRLRHVSQSLLASNQQLQAQNELLASMSLTDLLTGTLNRRALEIALPGLLQQVRDREAEIVEGGSYVLYYRYLNFWIIELDQYTDLATTQHQMAADQVLQVVGRRLQGNTLPGTLLYRYSQNRFAVVKMGLSPQRGLEFGEHLRAVVSQSPVKLPNQLLVPVTLTLGGIVISAERKLKAKAVIESAEQALAKAQEFGYNHAYLLEDEKQPESTH